MALEAVKYATRRLEMRTLARSRRTGSSRKFRYDIFQYSITRKSTEDLEVGLSTDEQAAVEGLQAIGKLPPEAYEQVLRKLAPVEVRHRGAATPSRCEGGASRWCVPKPATDPF